MPEENLKMLQWLTQRIMECEDEIHYLEEVLTTTSGPANQIVSDLEVNKARLAEYQREHSRYIDLEMNREKTF